MYWFQYPLSIFYLLSNKYILLDKKIIMLISIFLHKKNGDTS